MACHIGHPIGAEAGRDIFPALPTAGGRAGIQKLVQAKDRRATRRPGFCGAVADGAERGLLALIIVQPVEGSNISGQTLACRSF
jgi:hypothetical protein